MNPAITSSGQEQDFEIASEAFRVVVGYEDYASGVRAMQLYNHILEVCDESELQLNVWKFEPLGMIKLREAAAAEAVHADLVLISVRGDRVLPKEATDWIESWIHLKSTITSALGLLLDQQFVSHSNAEHTRRYLQELTSEAGIDFITSQSMKAEDNPSFEKLFERSTASSNLLESILQRDRSVDHWGINE